MCVGKEVANWAVNVDTQFTLKVGGALICSYQPGSHGSNKSGVCNCYSGKVCVGRSVNCMMNEHYY